MPKFTKKKEGLVENAKKASLDEEKETEAEPSVHLFSRSFRPVPQSPITGCGRSCKEEETQERKCKIQPLRFEDT